MGREICLELARRGCKVAVVDVNSKGCYETVELLSKIPRCTAKAYKVRKTKRMRSKTLTCPTTLFTCFSIAQNDVSSPRELQLMAVKVEKELGPVEILVNNASLMPMTSTPHLKSDEIDTILQLNLGSYIMVGNLSCTCCVSQTMFLSFLSQTTKEFLPKMITRKSGHLVAINALAGRFRPGLPGFFIWF